MGQAFANFLQAYSGPRRPGYFARNRKVIQRGTSHGDPARHQHRFSAARQALRMYRKLGTGRCLEARNGAVNGGAVDLWDCSSGESNERWYWPPSAAGGGSFTPGLQLQTWRCNGTRAQLFWVLQ